MENKEFTYQGKTLNGILNHGKTKSARIQKRNVN